MRVLVACEFSGVVREEFKAKGHDAWSCDLLPTEIPGQHIQGDVLEILNDGWDLMIAHPPCTYLTVTANRVFMNNPKRWQQRVDAMVFVYNLLNCSIPKIALENPKGVISTYIRKPDQWIQPYEYGHKDSKMTGLWLKNLPLLNPTNIVEPEWVIPPSGKRMSKTHACNPSTNNPGNAKLRSRTYIGIADAMAEQWG
jgi:hypothetical protein